MRVNRQIRAHQVRVINSDGEQLGVMAAEEALQIAVREGLDLVEIAPNSQPPVCKIIDYGKFRYDQTKREKENKKAQHVIKVKEVKVKPNIDDHDLDTKLRHAREFLAKGNKVKVTCTFRGRERAHPENGEKVIMTLVERLQDLGTVEAPATLMGKTMTLVMAPGVKKKKP